MYFVVLFISFFYVNVAHGDLHQRIIEVTDEIVASPDSAYLYFKRGKLFYQHESYGMSISDFLQAESMSFQHEDLMLYLAKNHYQLEENEKAMFYLDDLLAADSNMANALKLKAEIYFSDQAYEKSGQYYVRFLRTVRKAFPEDYVAASSAFELVDVKSAVEMLDLGIREIGPISSLLIAKRDLYLRHQKWELAVKVQEDIISNAHRKEVPLMKAYEMTGKQEYLVRAMEAWEKLPSRIKSKKSMRELINEIEINLSK